MYAIRYDDGTQRVAEGGSGSGRLWMGACMQVELSDGVGVMKEGVGGDRQDDGKLTADGQEERDGVTDKEDGQEQETNEAAGMRE